MRRRSADDDKVYEMVEAQDSVTLLDYLTDTQHNLNIYNNNDEPINIIGPFEFITSTLANKKKEGGEAEAEEEDDDSDEDSDEEEGGLLGERQMEEPVVFKPNTRTPLLLEVAARGHARMVRERLYMFRYKHFIVSMYVVYYDL